MEYCSVVAEWRNASYGNRDGTRDDLTKWSRSERERQIPNDIISMWNIKYDANHHIYKTKTDRLTENRPVVAKEVRGREGKEWGLGISRGKLLHMNGETAKSCYRELRSISCTNHNGKDMKRNIYVCVYIYDTTKYLSFIYVYKTESPCCTEEIGTTL